MTEASGFLGRWARRKNDALLGKPLTEPDVPVAVPSVVQVTPATGSAAPAPLAQEESEALPTLSLDDVKLLTKDSDFKPFMAQNVGPDVRNAAMKKLFEDPHFNIMDGLDIYIDDYSISEPIPESMLRQMASAKFLNLFEETDEEKEAAKQAAKDHKDLHNPLTDDLANGPVPGISRVETAETSNVNADQSVAQFVPTETLPPALDSAVPGIPLSSQPEMPVISAARQENHADPYLRLQPDHAPSDPDAGRGA